MNLVDRDYKIFKEIDRWRICLGRHIRYLTGFSGQRACDRRLHLLMESQFLERRKIVYGIPNIYNLTHKAKMLIGSNKRQEQTRLDQIAHDVTALDIAICMMKSFVLLPTEIKTDKQLHQEDGFGERLHHPDFIFTKNDKIYCVEVELSLKSKERLNQNLKSNFINYDVQIWVIGENTPKLSRLLDEFKTQYPNIEIVNITEVKNGAFKFIT